MKNKYPIYVISKGRWESRLTSKALERMKAEYRIVVEPQEYENYAKYIDKKKILVLPFSNLGQGSIPARNWVWEHAISEKSKKHWILDDNIYDFYRLNKNKRHIVQTPVIFRCCEDFTERYENVPISGMNYRFFVVATEKYPPFYVNTRVYSCILIDNSIKHRWRGRYNEDTDICLRVLKDGDCTVQFNAFLQGKCATQTVSGGNTEEFYHKEIGIDKETGEAIRSDSLEVKSGYNATGTVAKSQMLVDMHPDVASMVWRYGRWHHYVNYEPFKKNKLKYKPDVVVKKGVNNYGMKLITNYTEKV